MGWPGGVSIGRVVMVIPSARSNDKTRRDCDALVCRNDSGGGSDRSGARESQYQNIISRTLELVGGSDAEGRLVEIPRNNAGTVIASRSRARGGHALTIAVTQRKASWSQDGRCEASGRLPRG